MFSIVARSNSSIWTQLKGFKYTKWLNSSIWSIDETLIATTTPGQSGPGNSGNKRNLYILQNSRTGISPSVALVSYSGQLLRGGVLPLYQDAVGVFYSSSQLD